VPIELSRKEVPDVDEKLGNEMPGVIVRVKRLDFGGETDSNLFVEDFSC